MLLNAASNLTNVTHMLQFICALRIKQCHSVRTSLSLHRSSNTAYVFLSCSPGRSCSVMLGDPLSSAVWLARVKISSTRYSSTPMRNTAASSSTICPDSASAHDCWTSSTGNTRPARSDRELADLLFADLFLFIVNKTCDRSSFLRVQFQFLECVLVSVALLPPTGSEDTTLYHLRACSFALIN